MKLIKKITDRIKKITGANDYDEPPKRLQNFALGVLFCLALFAILKLFSIPDKFAVPFSFFAVVVYKLIKELCDKLENNYFNFCHFGVMTLGAGFVLIVLQII